MKSSAVIPIRVFVVGAPASGKTTARTVIADWLVARRQSVAVLGIEEAQRELFPPKYQYGSYEYEEDGALVLHQREWQIPKALTLLSSQCAYHRDALVVEIAHREIGAALTAIGTALLDRALVLHITAPTWLRLQRNRERGAARIPDAIVNGIPHELTFEERELIMRSGADLVRIEAIGRIEDLQLALVTVLTRFFSHLSGASDNSVIQSEASQREGCL